MIAFVAVVAMLLVPALIGALLDDRPLDEFNETGLWRS